MGGLRYDYSTGIWENGKMNGYGEVGYEYFDENTLAVVTSVRKIGYLSDDVFDGEVEYHSSQENEHYSWRFGVVQGILQIDERWEYAESEGKYRIPSEQDPGHVYAVLKDAVETIQWKNMLVWDQNN